MVEPVDKPVGEEGGEERLGGLGLEGQEVGLVRPLPDEPVAPGEVDVGS